MDFANMKENAGTNAKNHSILSVLSLINTLTFLTITSLIAITLISSLKNNNTSVVLPVVLSLIFIVIWVFFTRIIRVSFARCALEGRIYENVTWKRIYYLRADQKRMKASFTNMTLIFIQQLWNITIIGGIMRHYSALMTPYILAENPSITSSEAFSLSREMMMGHKMEAFKNDLSLLGSYIVSIVTLGLAGMPYIACVHAEYYVALRSAFLLTDNPQREKLNDQYLYTVADEDNLKRMYKNTKVDEMYVRETAVTFKGLQAVLCNTFAILTGNKKEKKIYHGVLGLKEQLDTDLAASTGKAYPSRLSPSYNKENIHLYGNLSSNRSYTLTSLVQIFLVASFGTWLLELIITMITGVTPTVDIARGPWQPIAGLSMILSLTLLTSFRKNPVVTFIGALLITAGCSLLYQMPVVFTDVMYIAMIIVGTFVSLAFIYIIAPTVDYMWYRANNSIINVISIILFLVIIADLITKILNIALPF